MSDWRSNTRYKSSLIFFLADISLSCIHVGVFPKLPLTSPSSCGFQGRKAGSANIVAEFCRSFEETTNFMEPSLLSLKKSSCTIAILRKALARAYWPLEDSIAVPLAINTPL